MSVFGSKITIFHCFSPKNHCLAQFGRISVEILMATTRSRQIF